MPSLVIDKLTHVYPNGVRALDEVSLTIPNGLFGLLGPNGAGKSTLMRDVATLQAPTSGSIRFDDIDVVAEPQKLRRTLGYLPQDFGVYPRVSAYDMLEHMAVLKGLADGKSRRETVERLLTQTNLWNVRKKALASFSGGMRQRFGIAQALIGDPSLIIVDEPTAGLDPEERMRFLNLLAEIGENVVVILSTHIVEDVSDLCPRMAIIAERPHRARGRAGGADREPQGPHLDQGDRPRRAGRLPHRAPGDLHPPLRRQDGGPRARRRRPRRGLRAGRGRAGGRLLLHPLADAAGRLRGRRHVREDRLVRVPLPDAASRVLGGGGHFRADRLRVGGLRQRPDLGSTDNVHKNAPFVIGRSTLILAEFYMFVVAALVANVIVRDDETGFGGIIRSTRISKSQYLYGRFLGAFGAALVGYLAVPIGLWLGASAWWIDHETLGPFVFTDYLWAYVVLAVPVIFFTAALFFAVTTVTRSMMWTYVGVVVLFIGGQVMGVVLRRPGYEHIAALWEPFGAGAYGAATRYWTPFERNSQVPALAGDLLAHLLIWLGAALALLAAAYGLFRFQGSGRVGRASRKAAALAEAAAAEPAPQPLLGQRVRPVFDARAARAQLWARTKLDAAQVFKQPGLLRLAGARGSRLGGQPVVLDRGRSLRRQDLSGHAA